MNSGRWETGVAECELCFRTLTLDPLLITYTAFNCGHLFCGPCIQGAPELALACPVCGMKLGMWGFAASLTMLPIPYDLEAELLAAPPTAARMGMDDATILDDEGNTHNNNNEIDNHPPASAHATKWKAWKLAGRRDKSAEI